jgi:hypothetical protein
MVPTPAVRQLRHDLRGQVNTLVLSAAALTVADDDRDRIEFLRSIETAADKLLAVLDQLDSLPGAFDD